MKSLQAFFTSPSPSKIMEAMFDEDFSKRFDKSHGIVTLIKEKSVTVVRGLQPWAKSDKSNISDLYDEIHTRAINSSKEFLRKMKVASRRVKDPKILVDIKSKESFIDKVVNRGKSASKITDVLRAAILLNDDSDVEDVVSQIKKDFKVAEFEKKSKGDDKQYGYYGSYHFLVDIDGMLCEIQVMTKKLWAYKKQAHKIYDKYRSTGEVDLELAKLDKMLSKNLFDKGNKGR